MPRKPKKPVHRTRIDGVLYPYDDAKKDVELQREIMDVWKGRPGEAGKCMNAVCIERNKNLFPHPVLAVSVIKSRVYILDSLDHAVRYTLSDRDSRLIEQHDTIAVGQPGTLTLRAPKGHNVKGAVHSTKAGRSGPHNANGQKNKPLARGEQARVVAAVGVRSGLDPDRRLNA